MADTLFLVETEGTPYCNICTKSVVELKIAKKSDKPIALKIEAPSRTKTKLLGYLRSKGVAVGAGSKEIRFTLRKRSNYSRSLGLTLHTFVIDAKAFDKNRLLKETSEECDESEVQECVFDIYIELAKVF